MPALLSRYSAVLRLFPACVLAYYATIGCSSGESEVGNKTNNATAVPKQETLAADAANSTSADSTSTETSSSLIAAMCTAFVNCPIGKDDQLLPSAFFFAEPGNAIDNCVLAHTAGDNTQMQQLLAGLIAAEERGTLEVDWAQVNSQAQCQSDLKLAPWFRPLAALGDTCRLDAECSGFCRTDTCPGACAALGQTGDTCAENRECDEGDCLDGRCSTRVPSIRGVGEGEACGFDLEPARRCAPGLFCSDAQCRSPIPSGEACFDNDDICAPGHFCLPTEDDDGAVCARVEILPDGASCGAPVAVAGITQMCNFVALSNCSEGTCTTLPAGAAGDPCLENDISSTCEANLYCDWNTRTCQEFTPVGAECSASQECHCLHGICQAERCSGW